MNTYNQTFAQEIEMDARRKLRGEIEWVIEYLKTAVEEADQAQAFGVCGRIQGVQEILRRELEREATVYIEAEAIRKKKKRA